MSIKKTITALALGAIVGACFAESNHAVGKAINKGKSMIKQHMNEMNSQDTTNAQG